MPEPTPAAAPEVKVTGTVLEDRNKEGSLEGHPNPNDPWEKEDWPTLVPEKFKDAEKNNEIKVKDLAKSYTILEKRFGAGEAAPKTPEDYKIELKLPEGVIIPEEQYKGFLKLCHGAGMSNKQVQFVMSKYGEIIFGLADNKNETIKGLKTEWVDDFDKNMGLAYKALISLVDEPDRAVMMKAGNNPAVIKLLAKLGKDLEEDTMIAGSAGEEEDIKVLQRSEAYWKADHPEHEKVVAKVTAYYKTHKRK